MNAPFLSMRGKLEHTYHYSDMRLIAQVRLDTKPEQAGALKRTMNQTNEAQPHLSERAWDAGIFGQVNWHRLACYDTSAIFSDLSSPIIVRSISDVADACKPDRKGKRPFTPYAAITCDQRLLRWYTDRQEVSIWTLEGRLHIPHQCGRHQRLMLKVRQGQADLVYRNGGFYLHLTYDIESPDLDGTDGWLGVDLGPVNLAVDAAGETFSGAQLGAKRRRYAERRKQLQSIDTKSAKRRLKRLSGRQARFPKDTNHCIRKMLVAKVRRHNLGIALEDLNGISKSTAVGRAQRSRHYKGSFYPLPSFLSHKAELFGVSVQLVDPCYTSQAGSICGHVAKGHRPTLDTFLHERCGFSGPADGVAAVCIAARAAVNQPMVSTEKPKGYSPIAASSEVRDKLPVETGSS